MMEGIRQRLVADGHLMNNLVDCVYAGLVSSCSVHSPLEKGDHPELDTSQILDPDMVHKYQSIIGSLQMGSFHGKI